MLCCFVNLVTPLISPQLLSSGFTLDFRFYDRYYIIAAYILLYHLCSIPPVSFSYHIIPWVFPTWYHLLYISTCFCMLVLTTWFSIHVFDSDLSIHVCLSSNATWHSHHHSLGSSDSLGFSYSGPGAWSVWILPVADLRSAVIAWISSRPFEALSFQAPLRVSRVFLL